jgi:hypothetical protein
MAEKRTRTEIRFEPEGPEVPGPIASFRLAQIEHDEIRPVAGRGAWHQDEWSRSTVLASGLTRRQVSQIVADGADWLAYLEGES